MFFIILLIFIIFSVALFGAWYWYTKFELNAHQANLFSNALKLVEKGDFIQASEALKEFVESHPNSVKGNQGLGKVYLDMKMFEKAKACYLKLLELKPGDVESIENLALIANEEKNYEEAIDLYQKAALLNPSETDYEKNIAIISIKEGKYKKALDLLQKLLEKEPEDTLLKFYLAKCNSELVDLSNQEEFQKTMQQYEELKGLENLPKEYETCITKAYAKSGNIEKTIEIGKEAVKKDSENVEIYKLLGLSYLINEDFETAKGVLTTGLSLDSEEKELHKLMSYVLCRQEKRCAVRECQEKYHEVVAKMLEKNKPDDV